MNKHHRFPVGAHPLTETPILRIQDGYVLPVPSAMLEALRPRMEDLIQRKDLNVWNRYAKARADFVEEESVRRIAQTIPGAKGATALQWKSTSDESDLDGLLSVDDFTLRIQAAALIKRLEEERPSQWVIAAMALLMGDDATRQQLDQRLAHAANRRLSHGWSNTTQILAGTGLTYYMDYRQPRAQFEYTFAAYIDEKMTQGLAATWIAIGDCGDGHLVVALRSTGPVGVAQAFLSGPNADA